MLLILPLSSKNDDGSLFLFTDIGEAIDSVQNDKLYFRFFDQTSNQEIGGIGHPQRSNSQYPVGD